MPQQNNNRPSLALLFQRPDTITEDIDDRPEVSDNKNDDVDVDYDPQERILLRHDSEFSIGSNYDGDDSPNDLSVWSGAALLTADCLGTGILALPGNVHDLGWTLGLGFLFLNLPINLYAGTILHHAATAVESHQGVENQLYTETASQQPENIINLNINTPAGTTAAAAPRTITTIDYRAVNASTVNSEISTGSYYSPTATGDRKSVQSLLLGARTKTKMDYRAINADTIQSNMTGKVSIVTTGTLHTQLHHDTATFDFIGMTQALFQDAVCTRWVMLIYYTNIFLVLGNYILVMSHAVSATFGGDMCYPTAGIIASAGMFVVISYSRTMVKLGRTASVLSLLALFVVVVQCLVAARQKHHEITQSSPSTDEASRHSILRQLSAMGSIGFAVGSQKLFLNIRHEFACRSVAPRSLALSLSAFGTFYVLVIILAGPQPPGFLFDAIPGNGRNRRIAGFLLWAHVVVSYAINSQAITSSLDRLVGYRVQQMVLPSFMQGSSARWMTLTGIIAVTAYLVANAIPFFKDLVALIGALTSVPLTLLLPAVLWRKYRAFPIWQPSWGSLWSYALLVFSVTFMITATVGSVYSIQQDWLHQGAPFSCH